MVGVQKFVRTVRHRLLQIVFVTFDDGRIFVRESQSALFIQFTQIVAAFRRQLRALVDRLPAAARTTARTSHDLDEIVFRFAAFYRIHQFAGIAQAVRHRDGNFRARHVEFSFLPAVHAAHGIESVGIGILARHEEIRAAQRRFHHDHPHA